MDLQLTRTRLSCWEFGLCFLLHPLAWCGSLEPEEVSEQSACCFARIYAFCHLDQGHVTLGPAATCLHPDFKFQAVWAGFCHCWRDLSHKCLHTRLLFSSSWQCYSLAVSARSSWVCAGIEASVWCAWGEPFCLKGYHSAFAVDRLCLPQRRCSKIFAKSPLYDAIRGVTGHL